MLGRFFEGFCRFFFKVYCPMTVKGKENLPEPPYILCSNHSSHLDCPALIVASGLPFKRFGVMAAKDYFFDNTKRNKWVASLFQIIPIDRKARPETILKSIAFCKEFCTQGERNLIIFPEGTRSRTGEIQSFKKGAALWASELKLPLVPAYIDNTFASWPKGKHFPKPKKICIAFGKPITIAASSRTIATELENQIKQLKEIAHGK